MVAVPACGGLGKQVVAMALSQQGVAALFLPFPKEAFTRGGPMALQYSGSATHFGPQGGKGGAGGAVGAVVRSAGPPPHPPIDA
mmetsp:Transcript_136874/g.237833  ORF Transcript_136874/g.237833 Transcript_136874/m.237833 type:complete len:84 (+) Transcript_136874:2738-2989(+)